MRGNSAKQPSRARSHRLRYLWGGMGVLAGVGAGLLGYALLREPLGIEFEKRTIYLDGAQGRLPERGLRILHVSDTHFQGINWRERTKINQVRRLTAGLEYDLLIHTGDFWHNEVGLHNLLDFIDLLPKPRLGAYGVLGNHDYACYSHADALTRNWAKFQTEHENGTQPAQPQSVGSSLLTKGATPYHTNGYHAGNGTAPVREPITSTTPSLMEILRNSWQFAQYILNVPFELSRVAQNDIQSLVHLLAERNLTVLHNRAVRIQHRPGQPDGVDLYLVGVDDVCEGRPDLSSALRDVPEDATRILLSHHPDILEESASHQMDLILSGHTHGGQISLPWVGAAHTHSLHLSRREAAGYLRRGRAQVYISRGIGEGIPLRFGARPQITLLTLLAK